TNKGADEAATGFRGNDDRRQRNSVCIGASTVLWKAEWDEFIEQSIRQAASSHKFTFCDNH
ncbi:hypothetical protein Tco_1240419, partial [Tanacetum coccineum]